MRHGLRSPLGFAVLIALLLALGVGVSWLLGPAERVVGPDQDVSAKDAEGSGGPRLAGTHQEGAVAPQPEDVASETLRPLRDAPWGAQSFGLRLRLGLAEVFPPPGTIVEAVDVDACVTWLGPRRNKVDAEGLVKIGPFQLAEVPAAALNTLVMRVTSKAYPALGYWVTLRALVVASSAEGAGEDADGVRWLEAWVIYPKTRLLVGHVVDARGHPVGGAEVVHGTRRLGSSDSVGEFTVFVPVSAAPQELHARMPTSAAGEQSRVGPAKAVPARPLTGFKLLLPIEPRIAGTLSTPGGDPLEGVEIIAVPAGQSARKVAQPLRRAGSGGTSNAQGAFAIHGGLQEGEYDLYARGDLWAWEQLAERVEVGVKDVALQFDRRRVRVVCVDAETGESLDAHVIAHAEGRSGGSAVEYTRAPKHLGYVQQPGSEITFVVSALGYEARRVVYTMLKAPWMQTFEVSLKPTEHSRALRMIAVDPEGAPVIVRAMPQVQDALTGLSLSPVLTWIPDSQQLLGVPEGRLRVTLGSLAGKKPDAEHEIAQPIVVEAGPARVTDVHVVVGMGGRLQVRIEQDWQPGDEHRELGPLRLALKNDNGQEVAALWEGPMGGKGQSRRVELDSLRPPTWLKSKPLPPGRYVVELSGDGWEVTAKTIDVEAKKTYAVKLRPRSQ